MWKSRKIPNPLKILRTAKKGNKQQQKRQMWELFFFLARMGVLVKVDRYKADKHVY